MAINSSGAKANQMYLDRKREEGIVRVNLLVPEWARLQIRKYADGLRRSAGHRFETPEQKAIAYLEEENARLKAKIEKLING